MALSVSRARVKDRCGITDTGLDATIDALIAELLPVVEFAIRPEHLASPNPGVQATLQLAALELVCGELLAQLARSPGASEEVSVAGLTLRPTVVRSLADPSGLLSQAERRLAPFLNEDPSGTRSGVASARVLAGANE